MSGALQKVLLTPILQCLPHMCGDFWSCRQEEAKFLLSDGNPVNSQTGEP